jgi:hypothetical protein
MSDSGPRRSPTHAAGIVDPLTGKSFQDQLALSRFAPGETVGLGPDDSGDGAGVVAG